MATGFDSRAVTRDSFGFNPAAPAQSQAGLTGASAGATVQGGNSGGEVHRATPLTLPDPLDTKSGLGGFIGGLMEPYLKRKQEAQFRVGYQAAASGKAIEEISQSEAGFSRIFGPSGYEQGASVFTAEKSVNQWAIDQGQDIDRLKRLSPADAGKAISESSRALHTGHQATDDMIDDAVMKQSGPLFNTVAKARYVWQQGEIVRARSESSSSAATLLQTTFVNQNAMGDAADADPVATVQAGLHFTDSLVQVTGQSDDSYRTFLGDTAKNTLQAGNFAAYNLMVQSGVMAVLPEATQDRITLLEDAASKKAYEKFEPELREDLLRLDLGVKVDPTNPGYLNPLAAQSALVAINTKFMRLSGASKGPFDAADIAGVGKGAIDALVGYSRRAEARTQQLSDAAALRSQTLQDKQAEVNAEVGASQTAWANGMATEAVATGTIKSTSMDILAINDVNSGNFAGISANFARGSYVSAPAAKLLQAQVTASSDKGYTVDFKAAQTKWTALYTANPGAALAYYGTANQAKFMAFNTMAKAMSPELAYMQSFGNPAIFGAAEIPRERRAEFVAGIPGAIEAQDGISFFGKAITGREPLSENGAAVLSNVYGRSFARLSQNSDLPTDQILTQVVAASEADGTVERQAGQVWANRAGTVPIWKMAGFVNAAQMDAPFHTTLDTRLKAAGFADGIAGNMSIQRVDDAQGANLHVFATDDAGKQYHVNISSRDLHDAQTAIVQTAADATERTRLMSEANAKSGREQLLAGKDGKFPTHKWDGPIDFSFNPQFATPKGQAAARERDRKLRDNLNRK